MAPVALSTEPPSGLIHTPSPPISLQSPLTPPLLMANPNLNMGVSTLPPYTHTHHPPLPLFDAVIVVCGFPLWRSSGQHHKVWQCSTISTTRPERSLTPIPQTRMWSRGLTTAHCSSLAKIDCDAMNTEEQSYSYSTYSPDFIDSTYHNKT